MAWMYKLCFILWSEPNQRKPMVAFFSSFVFVSWPYMYFPWTNEQLHCIIKSDLIKNDASLTNNLHCTVERCAGNSYFPCNLVFQGRDDSVYPQWLYDFYCEQTGVPKVLPHKRQSQSLVIKIILQLLSVILSFMLYAFLVIFIFKGWLKGPGAKSNVLHFKCTIIIIWNISLSQGITRLLTRNWKVGTLEACFSLKF